jgi:hypothetical protein
MDAVAVAGGMDAAVAAAGGTDAAVAATGPPTVTSNATAKISAGRPAARAARLNVCWEASTDLSLDPQVSIL